MLRIIAGELRGRRISAPPGKGTRPTADQVREGLFNTLVHLKPLEGAGVWDLYAGSGALGIEALSRGAAHVTFVEQGDRAVATIRANLASLALDRQRFQVVPGKVERWLGTKKRDPGRKGAPPGPVDLVLMDPPYADAGVEEILVRLSQCANLASDALVVVECAHATPPRLPAGLVPLRVKRYGDTQILILEMSASPGPESAPPSEKKW